MSQILSQAPRQLLQQQQRLTPQLIQAMDILQLNAMALESRISQEIDANPALEAVPLEDETPQAERQEPERDDRDQALVVEEGAPAEFERLDNLVREYDWFDEDVELRASKSRARLAEEGDMKLDAMANAAARPETLAEHLLGQWSMLEVDDDTRRAGALIIGSLTETGRLETPLEELAAQLDPAVTVPLVEDALARVQQLDPPGVGARDLQECLLLQIESLPGDTDLARRIVEEQFERLQHNRLPEIAKALGVELGQVKAALQEVGRLAMHPGLDVGQRVVPPVVPDVIVEHDAQEDRYETRLARANQREVRISREFREALQSAGDDRKTRDYIKQKLEAASAIIDALNYRRGRLLDVARSVVEAQRDFLDLGEQHIRPLRMHDLAERFECDPSTISRTVDQKWIQTPRGIFPLRRFFTGGAKSDNGEDLGWDSIKAKVKEIVDSEDKGKPLNDDEIVAALRRNGIDIKRRTVAKYRAQLDIPVARQRRQY